MTLFREPIYTDSSKAVTGIDEATTIGSLRSSHLMSKDWFMGLYASLSDDFYVNVNLNTEMELSSHRETILHFFERIQKQYPSMKNFYSRDRGEFVLEEEKDQGHYRWASVDSARVCSGYVNPGDPKRALDQHRLVMELVPYALSVSPLDCESLNLMFGFDFNYQGNHNELIADALGVVPAFDALTEPSAHTQLPSS